MGVGIFSLHHQFMGIIDIFRWEMGLDAGFWRHP